MPLTRRLLLGLRGFYPEKHSFYEFEKYDRTLYVSDLQMMRSSRINKQCRIIVDNKLLFEMIVGRFARVPVNLVWVRNAQPLWLVAPPAEQRSLPELVRQKLAVIAKPVYGSAGRGVQLLEFKNGCFWRNGVRMDESRLNWKTLGIRNVLISEYIKQGSFANGLYPGSVNTIRLLTMLDPDTQCPFIAAAFIRVGCDRSAPVDNIACGGLICNIEPDSGRLGKALVGFNLDGPARWIVRHPDSGVVFEDQAIPNWSSIREQTITLASKIPMLPYIAWDLAILDDGIAVIEANSWSGLGFIQMTRPLLLDPRVRKFFEYHDIL